MKASNISDIALAQEWIASLDQWQDTHPLTGFDPFDVKAHPWIQSAQNKKIPRKITTLLCDLYPHAARSFLKIQPSDNPKAYALCAMGDLRLHALTGEERLLQRARTRLQWLEDNAITGHSGPAWGYPFPFSGAGVHVPANTPVSVVTATVGLAFLEAWAMHHDAAHLSHAQGAARMLLNDMPRLDASAGSFCFAYALTDTRRVHNANLLVAELLIRVGSASKDEEMSSAGMQSLRYTLSRQMENGAWPYGEHSPGEECDPALMRLVDHHHTGFVLRSLQGILRACKNDDVGHALKKGFGYYKTLFTPIGQPLTAHGAWPVDIHACTEAILCPSVLSGEIFGAKKYAILALRWTHFFMRDHATDLPIYRKYPFFSSRIMYPRWGLAWLYLALAEFLSAFYEEEE